MEVGKVIEEGGERNNRPYDLVLLILLFSVSLALPFKLLMHLQLLQLVRSRRPTGSSLGQWHFAKFVSTRNLLSC